MYNLNVIRILNILGLDMNSENIQKAEQLMSVIPCESRNIIEIRWGLIEDAKAYYRFSDLDKAMGINNSKDLYSKAIKQLKTAQYVNLLLDREKFSWEQAVNLGKLAVLIFAKDPETNTIIGEGLLDAIETLTSREIYVITYATGLRSDNGYTIVSLEKIAKKLVITKERVKQIQAKALRKLRHPNRAKEFSMDAKASYEKFQEGNVTTTD